MDDYDILDKCGKGSYGEVVRVKIKADDRVLVMKTVSLEGLQEADRLETLNECLLMKKVVNPHVIGYLESFIENMTLCIVMEWAAGGDLAMKIKQHRECHQFIDEETLWRFVIEICIGLKSLHDQYILHRDLKAQNVFLDSDNRIKIGDLGLGRIMSTQSSFANSVVGSPLYFSPELCQDKPYNQKSDIWSFGCLMYELANLIPPFYAANPIALAQKIVNEKPQPVQERFSPDFRFLVGKLLEKDARRRPSIDQILTYPAVALRTSYWRMKKSMGVVMAERDAALVEVKLVNEKLKLFETDNSSSEDKLRVLRKELGDAQEEIQTLTAQVARLSQGGSLAPIHSPSPPPTHSPSPPPTHSPSPPPTHSPSPPPTHSLSPPPTPPTTPTTAKLRRTLSAPWITSQGMPQSPALVVPPPSSPSHKLISPLGKLNQLPSSVLPTSSIIHHPSSIIHSMGITNDSVNCTHSQSPPLPLHRQRLSLRAIFAWRRAGAAVLEVCHGAVSISAVWGNPTSRPSAAQSGGAHTMVLCQPISSCVLFYRLNHVYATTSVEMIKSVSARHISNSQNSPSQSNDPTPLLLGAQLHLPFARESGAARTAWMAVSVDLSQVEGGQWPSLLELTVVFSQPHGVDAFYVLRQNPSVDVLLTATCQLTVSSLAITVEDSSSYSPASYTALTESTQSWADAVGKDMDQLRRRSPSPTFLSIPSFNSFNSHFSPTLSHLSNPSLPPASPTIPALATTSPPMQPSTTWIYYGGRTTVMPLSATTGDSSGPGQQHTGLQSGVPQRDVIARQLQQQTQLLSQQLIEAKRMFCISPPPLSPSVIHHPPSIIHPTPTAKPQTPPTISNYN